MFLLLLSIMNNVSNIATGFFADPLKFFTRNQHFYTTSWLVDQEDREVDPADPEAALEEALLHRTILLEEALPHRTFLQLLRTSMH